MLGSRSDVIHARILAESHRPYVTVGMEAPICSDGPCSRDTTPTCSRAIPCLAVDRNAGPPLAERRSRLESRPAQYSHHLAEAREVNPQHVGTDECRQPQPPGAVIVSEQQTERPMDRVNRYFVADRPNQLWVADLTYISTWQKPVGVCGVRDRRVLANDSRPAGIAIIAYRSGPGCAGAGPARPSGPR